jgi:hypothetical protein
MRWDISTKVARRRNMAYVTVWTTTRRISRPPLQSTMPPTATQSAAADGAGLDEGRDMLTPGPHRTLVDVELRR